jgi:tRNA nucleotidyltransferase/poly(A) polymerase
MAEDTTTTETTETEEETTTVEEEQRVPYERFQQANKKAKEAADRAKALERDMADLRAQIAERDEKGLPELDQLKRRLEQAEKRAQDAETKAGEFEQQVTNARRERWITAAAQSQGFEDPDDATRYVDVGDIESAEDAERAVKRVARSKKYLLKSEEPVLPGKVLNGGRQTGKDGEKADELPPEALVLAEGLRQFASKE